MKLYNYWRSSASWRVRLALAIKGLPYEYVAVNLQSSEQRGEGYLARNPQGLVPLLELDDGRQLAQSVAILEYLEETHPTPALLPRDPVERAQVRRLVEHVNSGLQPFQNLTTTQYVRDILQGDDRAFAQHFIRHGLTSLERLAEHSAGTYLVGDTLTLADCVLTPQLYGSRRFGVDTEAYPTLTRIERTCAAMPVFHAAHAEQQPDAKP